MDKSIVIPYEVFNKMNHELKETDPLISLESELHEIMQNKTMSNSEKMLLYSQLIQKYTRLVHGDIGGNNNNQQQQQSEQGQQQQPVAGSNNNVYNMLINNVGIRSKKHAINLYEYLDQLSNITWGDNGEIVLNNEVIRKSNIVDVIIDLVKMGPQTTRISNPPVGIYKIVNFLKSINIPKVFIKNSARWNSPSPAYAVIGSKRKKDPITSPNYDALNSKRKKESDGSPDLMKNIKKTKKSDETKMKWLPNSKKNGDK